MRDRIARKIKRPNRVFLVICEGESEKCYVESLKREFRLPITVRTRISGNEINSRLLAQYIKELGVSDYADCSVFFIYDGDVECVASKLKRLNGKTILSYPCFELWYLLHIKDFRRAADSDAICKALKSADPVWETYRKGTLSSAQINLLTTNRAAAIERSRKLNAGENPSTEIPLFIEALISAKNP